MYFAEYASDDSWIAVHIGQFAGGMMISAEDLWLSFACSCNQNHTASVLAWIGLAVAIMTASAIAVLQVVDGIALKMAVDSWIDSPPEEKAITFRVAEGIRFIECGLRGISTIIYFIWVIILGGLMWKKSMLKSL